MVNYRRVVCEAAALATLVVAALAAPAPAPDCKQATHYDQRQNGSDNIRVHVDGVVVAVMPAESFAESLLSALPDLSEFLEEDDFDIQKPKPPQNEVEIPPSIPVALSKPEEKPQAVPDKIPEALESAPIKPIEASTSEAGSTAQPTKNLKKEQYLKQRKAQRVKNYLASFLLPLLRKNRHH